MLSDWVEPQWERPRGVRKVHVVAVLCALLAAGLVLLMFSEFGLFEPSTRGDRQLVARVDLRIGGTAAAFAEGEAQAHKDVEAGQLKLQTAGKAAPASPEAAARAQRLKKRFGISWVSHGDAVSPKATAFVAGYNHVVAAELERRHGAQVAEQLLGGEES